MNRGRQVRRASGATIRRDREVERSSQASDEPSCTELEALREDLRWSEGVKNALKGGMVGKILQLIQSQSDCLEAAGVAAAIFRGDDGKVDVRRVRADGDDC